MDPHVHRVISYNPMVRPSAHLSERRRHSVPGHVPYMSSPALPLISPVYTPSCPLYQSQRVRPLSTSRLHAPLFVHIITHLHHPHLSISQDPPRPLHSLQAYAYTLLGGEDGGSWGLRGRRCYRGGRGADGQSSHSNIGHIHRVLMQDDSTYVCIWPTKTSIGL